MSLARRKIHISKVLKPALWFLLVVYICVGLAFRINSTASLMQYLTKSAESDSSSLVAHEGLVGLDLGAKVESFNTDELTKLTNQERTSAGVAAVTQNATLNQSASAKCADMVTKNYWSHNAPDGTEPWVFFQKVGYQYSTAGENLAYGFATNQDVVTGWMNSPLHKANILGAYSEVGFGICESDNYQGGGHQVVIVQHFGKAGVKKSNPTAAPAPAPAYVPKPYVASVCTKMPIPYKTNYIPASYLYEGQTNEYGGINGYLEQCTADSTGYKPSDFTYPPYDKTVYVGTKPNPTPPVPSP